MIIMSITMTTKTTTIMLTRREANGLTPSMFGKLEISLKLNIIQPYAIQEGR